MGELSIIGYLDLLDNLSYNVSRDVFQSLMDYAQPIMEAEQQDRYSEPMPWIGIYIALASIFCILAMVADLLHGLKNRKLWFPCNYFTLNAASLSVIAVAIKLPMDLNNSMRSNTDQVAKLGSMAFMCTMMANFLPSLATMDNKELLTNIIALVVLVITLVVNVCIQIKTGVVSIPRDTLDEIYGLYDGYIDVIRYMALGYVVMLIALLIIHTCSALTILRSKQILEPKYKAGHERALEDIELQTPARLNVEKLKQLVSRYWIMAGTGSPQFMAACSATTTASGVICTATTLLHSFNMVAIIVNFEKPKSDYKWSIPVISIIQFIGVVLGTIAPLSRCFASLSFKMSKEWIWEHIKVFKVESYWTQKLDDWKQSSITFPLRSRNFKVVIENSKFLILSICIGIQKTVVVVCKMMALIPIFFMACLLFCSFCWKWLKVKFSASGTVLGTEHHQQPHQNEGLRPYVLKLQDDMEPAGRTLKRILNSMNHLIKKAENQPPKKLMNLLKEFQGVLKFDSQLFPPLLLEEYPNCWSLPLVTLTAIAISLPNIEHEKVGSLVSSVGEGMLYVTLVEESLNATDEYVRIQKAAKMLWLQVDVYHKWLGNKLKDPAHQGKTTRQNLEWFRDTAAKICGASKDMDIERLSWNSFFRYICATSMDCITQTILLSYQDNIGALADTPCFPTNNGKMLDQEELFVRLSSMIAEILASCFSNLPKVIAMRCHTSVIEKMEASVYTAAQLLGETTQIINLFEDQELPSLDPDESMPHPFP